MCSDCLVLRENLLVFKVPGLYKYFQIFIKYIGINIANIYVDLESQKAIGPLSTLSNLSTWCQVISKIKKSQKSVKATLGTSGTIPNILPAYFGNAFTCIQYRMCYICPGAVFQCDVNLVIGLTKFGNLGNWCTCICIQHQFSMWIQP
jgi:hypothetical protein